jgi:tetratricopeptide (TPR) repeat protein
MNYVETIKSFISRDRFKEALEYCENILKDNPNNIEVILQKTWILSTPIPEVSNPKSAIILLINLIPNWSILSDLHKALGLAYEADGQYGQAAEAYQVSLSIKPDQPDIYVALASLCGASGVKISLHDAIKYLEKAIASSPNKWELHNSLAWYYWRDADLYRASEQYRISLACNPGPDIHWRKIIEERLQRAEKGGKWNDQEIGTH